MKKLLTILLLIPLTLFSFDYLTQWDTIEKLDRQQLPKSALKKVNMIYKQSKEEKNTLQFIRASIYKKNYATKLKEYGAVSAINIMNKAVEEAFSLEGKVILNSLLAEFYATYLDENYYKISQRTNVKENKNKDISTWSVEELLKKSTELYLRTLKPQTQKISLKKYQSLLTKGKNVEDLYPTLYDFLAFRALAYFQNTKYTLQRFNQSFKLSKKNAFTPAHIFRNYPFIVDDSLSYNALLTYQKLLHFHQHNKYPLAQMHHNLERLLFAKQNITQDIENTGTNYENALKNIIAIYPNSEALCYLADSYVAEGKWVQAMHYAKQGIQATNNYTKQRSLNIKNNLEERNLALQTEEVSLPHENILARLKYRNIEKLFIKVLKPNADELKKLAIFKNTEEKTTYLRTLSSFKDFSINLPKNHDYKAHSTEVSLNSYPLGSYFFLFSDTIDFSKNLFHQKIDVSNISYLEQKNRLLLLHRKTGEPLRGVKAIFTVENNYQKKFLEEKVSDKNGFISLPNIKNSYQVAFQYYDDQLVSSGYIQNYYMENDAFYRQVYFFTDRSIYRPNQTLYFKGLAVETSNQKKPKILSNINITVNFRNQNNQLIESKEFKTDEFGTFHGEFKTPSSGLLGHMQLDASIYGSAYVRVEEYKRPKFEVSFNKLKKAYALGDNISLTAKVKAYAGNAIANATVKYSITRESDFPWRQHWQPILDSHLKTIKKGEIKTDEQGLFHINFDANYTESLLNESPTYHYKVTAKVTDTTGETHQNSKTIILSMAGIKVDIRVNTDYSTDENKTISLKTSNLNGEFQALKGEVIIKKIAEDKYLYKQRYWDDEEIDSPLYSQETFEKLFPNYEFLGEKEQIIETLIRDIPFDTQVSKEIDLGSLQQGKYSLTINTVDKKGNTLSKSKTFQVYDLNAKKPHIKSLLWQRANKDNYQVGENAIVYIKSSIDNLPILLSIYRSDKTTKEEWIHLNKLSKTLIKLKDSDKGGVAYQINFVHENRAYQEEGDIHVPWNMDLKVEYLSFRDKLKPNEEEQWKLKISGKGKEKIMAQMVATMYDASLDTFAMHNFNPLKLYPNFYRNYRLIWRENDFSTTWLQKNWKLQKLNNVQRVFQDIKWTKVNIREARGFMNNSYGYKSPLGSFGRHSDLYQIVNLSKSLPSKEVPSSTIHFRKNFKETMFFKPNLQTDEEGNIVIDFKTNEALTRWNFMAFVHTKDLKTAVTRKTLTTSKELMVVSNLPRFFREKDQISLSAKVVNMSKKDLNGTCELKLVDPITDKPIFERKFKQNISIKKGASTVVEFKFTVPNVDEVSAIKHTIIAKTETHSDAEQIIKPILSNRVFITESKNMFVKAHEKKRFTLASLKKNTSTTLSNHKLTLEFTSNPAWYAIKSLPYLMEYPHESNEQLFNRYFANALASKMANSSPKIKKIFESWKSKGELISALETNKELKSVLLEETPWVLNAKSEAEQQANLGMLFDLVRLAKEEKSTYNKLIKRQFEHNDGGWAWFESPHSNWYITQYIVEGFGKLKKLGIDKTNTEAMGVATHYMDMKMLEQYKKLLKNVEKYGLNLKDDHLNSILIHYLYARSFYTFNMSSEIQKAHNYYLEQSKKYWVNKGLYEQGMIALTLDARQEKNSALTIVKSLKKRAFVSDELGMYFKYNNGYYWNQMPIETHALMIDVFNTVTNDKQSVERMKTWLLKNKQTAHWKTTKATASAIYALLSDVKWLENNKAVELSFDTKLPYKEKLEKAEVQTDTNYIKVDYKNFDQSMATIKVNNPNDNIAWGALYWQYFEEMDKVKNFRETPLTINKKLYLIEQTNKGEVLSPIRNQALKVGDKIKVRIELHVDRDMEYIMLKDARASAFEPVNVLSQYKYQDGLGYYESTKDNATYFFMDYLRKGTYVFEYPLVVTHKGDFSNGITTIESMYAPEFKSHSKGVRVLVK